MIIHDYECNECGNVQEEYLDSANIPATVKCSLCGAKAVKIVSVKRSAPIDSPPWISSVLEVVDKKSDKPHCKEFLRHPTRSNFKNWMKGEGLRPLEDGEKCLPSNKRTKEQKENTKKQMLRRYRERNSISVSI